MADWNFPPDTDVDPDAPVTSELMYALRDNPVAIAEGAVGAPRIAARSLISNYLAVLDVNGTAPRGFNDVGWLKSISCRVNKVTPTNVQLQISFSNDNGSSWGGWQNIYGNIVSVASFDIDLESGVVKGGHASDTVVDISLSLTVPSKVDAFRFRYASAGERSMIEVRITGGRQYV